MGVNASANSLTGTAIPATPRYASVHADSTLTAAGSAGQRSSRAEHSTTSTATTGSAAHPVRYDAASDHNDFRQASADAAETQCHATGSGSGAGTHPTTRTRTAVALPDRRSQRGWGNARRAANGEPDGHSRREPQLPPCGNAC